MFLPLGLVVHEDVEILLLQLQGDLGGDLLVGRRAHDGGKAWGGAVNKLDAALAEDDVVGRAQPDVVRQSGPRSWCRNSGSFR